VELAVFIGLIPFGLLWILDTMREGNPKILVDIFGKEWAKELTKLAIFLKRLLDD